MKIPKKMNLAGFFTRSHPKISICYRAFLLIFAIMHTNIAFAQQQPVSGTVTDPGGQPLPGVTVVVKGTNQGTVTGSDGYYELSDVPEDATLIFSFVGMRTQEAAVENRTTINATL